MISPVMKEAASEARKIAVPAISRALPKRRMGVRISSSSPRGVPSTYFCVIGGKDARRRWR